MVNCRDVELWLAPYVDGEAPSGTRAAVEAHLAECSPCRERVEKERATRAVLTARRSGLRACAPAALRARCAAQRAASADLANASPVAHGTSDVARGTSHVARERHVARNTWHVTRWLPVSVAATLLLAVGGLFLYSALNQVEALAAQLAVDHVKCAKFPSEREDPAVAARQWAAANGWTVQVPASAPERQLEFISLRRCLVTEGRTAHLMYRWRGEPLSVFVVPEALRDGPGQHTIAKLGHEATMWSANDRTYVVLARGQPSDQEIRPVVGYMKAHVR